MGLRKRVFGTALLCAIILGAGQPGAAAANHVGQLNSVEWLPSRYISIAKVRRQTLRIDIINRCAMLKNSFSGDINEGDGIQKIIDATLANCYMDRAKTYIPVVEELKALSFTFSGRWRRDAGTTNIGRPLRGATSSATFYSTFLLPQVQSVGVLA